MRGRGTGRGAVALLLGAALVLLAGTSTASRSAKDPVHALFFGDSLINGTGSSGPWEVRTAARDLDWQATVSAVGGTGYTTGGSHGKPYLTRLANGVLRVPYDVIVLEGGTNDARHGDLGRLRERALATVDYVHRAQPWARIVMVGGFAPSSVDRTRYEQMDAVLTEVAAARDLQYVSQLHYAELEGGFLSKDRYHPSADGYRLMGRDLAAALARR